MLPDVGMTANQEAAYVAVPTKQYNFKFAEKFVRAIIPFHLSMHCCDVYFLNSF